MKVHKWQWKKTPIFFQSYWTKTFFGLERESLKIKNNYPKEANKIFLNLSEQQAWWFRFVKSFGMMVFKI